MSDLGNTVGDVKKLGAWKALTIRSPRRPIGIKTPLERGRDSGETLFKMHFELEDQIKDNLKNLIMTQKGERLGFPDYGTNLRAIYSNTSISDEQIAEYAANEIKQAALKYMPSINLVQFYSDVADTTKVKNDAANILGADFTRIQGNIEIGQPELTDVNKNNPKLNSLYMIVIEYAVPLLNNKKYSIKLYINNSK